MASAHAAALLLLMSVCVQHASASNYTHSCDLRINGKVILILQWLQDPVCWHRGMHLLLGMDSILALARFSSASQHMLNHNGLHVRQSISSGVM